MKKHYNEILPHLNSIASNNLVDCKTIERVVDGKKEFVSVGDLVIREVGLPKPILKFDIYCHPQDGLMIRAVYSSTVYDVYEDINTLKLLNPLTKNE